MMHVKTSCKKLTIGLAWLLTTAMHNAALAAPVERSLQTRPWFHKDDGYKRLIGLTAGLGKIKTDDKQQGVSLYANAYLLWVNFSVEYQDFSDRSVTNTYTGLGLGRYLQIQYGYGGEGYLLRARSEFEIVGKLTLFVARERYRDKPEYDNYSLGIGYNFN